MGISGHASGGAVEGVTAAMTVLSFTAVAMRLYARLCVSKNAGWDDLMISISWVRTHHCGRRVKVNKISMLMVWLM